MLNERAPLTVRANLLRGTREALQARLAAEGNEATPTRFSPWGLTLDGHQNAFALAELQGGAFEIQDEGSQLIALACGARPGMTVVDACAGAGGKTWRWPPRCTTTGRSGRSTPTPAGSTRRGAGPGAPASTTCGPGHPRRRRGRRAARTTWPARPTWCWSTPPAAAWARCGASRTPAGGSRPGDPERFAALQRELVARFARARSSRAAGWSTPPAPSAGPRTTRWPPLAAATLPLRAVAAGPALGAERAAALGVEGHTLQLLPHRHGTDGFFMAAFERGARTRPPGQRPCPSCPRSSTPRAACGALARGARASWRVRPTPGPAASSGPAARPPSPAPSPGARLVAVDRHGKQLLLTLEAGAGAARRQRPPRHDRQVGRRAAAEPPPRHARLTLRLDDGARVHYLDPRMFGRLRLVPGARFDRCRSSAALGPDPVHDGIDPGRLGGPPRAPRAGPSRWRCSTSRCWPGSATSTPRRPAGGPASTRAGAAASLSPAEVARLARAIRASLRFGLASLDGPEIEYLEEGAENPFHVYGREGARCPRGCGGEIRRIVQAQRSTFFCPRCQGTARRRSAAAPGA